MADDNGGITYDGDVSKEELGYFKDSTKAHVQSQMRVAISAAAKHRDSDKERLNTLNGPNDPGKTQAALDSFNLRSMSRGQTSPRDPKGSKTQHQTSSRELKKSRTRGQTPPREPARSKTRGNSQASPTQSRSAQAIARYRSQDAPATVSNPTHISRRELGTFRVPTKAQHQSQLKALSYSPEKQQKIARQWAQTKGRAMNYVHSQKAERDPTLKAGAQGQRQPAAIAQTRTANQAQATAQSGQQKAKEPSVFERYSPKTEQGNNLKQVARNQAQTRTNAQAQSQPAQSKSKQRGKEPSKNAFDKHSPQRDKSKGKQPVRERSRGR